MIQWITRDWGLKLVSLVLAVGLWYYAVAEESIEVKRSIPLDIKVKNPQMSVLKSSVKNLWVTFSAPRHLLTDLTSKEISAEHEIGGDVKTAGDYSFRLEAREIKVPNPQIRIVKIIPETVQVTVDEQIVQKLKIKPDFSGEPAFGYSIREEEIQMDPNAILLEGPKGQLENLEFIMTEKIDLIGRIRSFRRTVGLVLPQNVHALSESKIDIFISIQEEFGEKEYKDIPVKILKGADQQVSVMLEPKAVTFVLRGSKIQLEKLPVEKIMAFADVSNLGPGDQEVEIAIPLPEEVMLAEKVKVLAKISKS